MLNYNESGTIRRVIDSIQEVLKKISCPQNEIIIVDDGSTDDSREKIENIGKKYANVRIIFHPRNLGIGPGLRNGYLNARYENVCAVPSDGQFDVNELAPYAYLKPKTFYSFYRKNNMRYSAKRKALSFINKEFNKIFLGLDLRDVNWAKIYNRSELEKLDLKLTSSLVESEICAKLILLHNKPIQVESIYQPRAAGKSKAGSFKIIFQVIKEMLKLTWYLYNFRKNIVTDETKTKYKTG